MGNKPNSILHFSLKEDLLSLWKVLADARELGGNGNHRSKSFHCRLKCLQEKGEVGRDQMPLPEGAVLQKLHWIPSAWDAIGLWL